MATTALHSPYLTWKCAIGCSRKYIWMTMPKNLQISGMEASMPGAGRSGGGPADSGAAQCGSDAPVAAEYKMSGSMSAPFGQQIVPSPGSTRTRAK